MSFVEAGFLGKKNKRKLTLRDLIFLLTLLAVAGMFRWQVAQAVNISSSSMEPTLYGASRGGDLVVLNKLAYKLGKPGRWDVIVFSMPDKKDSYIKRLVGLPGEDVLIKNGDVFINGRMAAKDAAVQKGLWLPVWSAARGARGNEDAYERAWAPMGGGRVSFGRGEGIEMESDSQMPLCGVRFRGEISDGASSRPNLCADLRLEFDVTSPADGTEVAGAILDNGLAYEFRVGVGEARGARISIGNKEAAWDDEIALTAGKRHHVGFYRVDGTEHLRIDGKTVLMHREEPFASEVVKTNWSGVQFGVRGGRGRFENVRLDRDIYYTSAAGRYGTMTPYPIPRDCYFLLGDNSANSQDSRTWQCIPRRDLIGRAVFIFNRLKFL